MRRTVVAAVAALLIAGAIAGGQTRTCKDKSNRHATVTGTITVDRGPGGPAAFFIGGVEIKHVSVPGTYSKGNIPTGKQYCTVAVPGYFVQACIVTVTAPRTTQHFQLRAITE